MSFVAVELNLYYVSQCL